MHFALEDPARMPDSVHSFSAGLGLREQADRDAPGGWANAWTYGSWMNGFTNVWSSCSPLTPFLFAVSSWTPSLRYRLGMTRRTRRRSLSTLPTWGRRSRLWMNCGGTFPILPVLFWKELAGWASSGTETPGHHLLVNPDSSPSTLRQSLGFPFQSLIQTEHLSEISLFPLYVTPIILVLNHRAKIHYGYRSSVHKLDFRQN